MEPLVKNRQYYKFCLYGFFKNLRLFDAFLVLFFLQNGLDYLLIGLLYGIREIAIMVLEIPSGIIADALGRRRTLMASFLFYIASFLVFYIASAWELMLMAMMLYAVGDAFRTGVHKAMIFQYLKANGWANQKVNYYGHTRSCSQTGSAFSALIAAALVFISGDISAVFLWTIIPYVVDFLLIYSYPKWLDGERHQLTFSLIGHEFKAVLRAFSSSLSQRASLSALVSTSLFSGYYAAIKDFIQPLIKSLALAVPLFAYYNNEQRTALFIGLIYFIIYLITAIASRLSGRIEKLFTNPFKAMNVSMMIGFLISLMGFSFYIVGWYGVPLGTFLWIMIVENIRKPIGIALVAELSHEKAMASVLSVTSQAKSIVAALIAFLTGWMADCFGLAWALVSILVLLLLLLPLYWMRTRN